MKSSTRGMGFTILALRWAARIIDLLVLGTLTLFVIGEGVPYLTRLTTIEAIQWCFFLGICLGLVVAFYWEGNGGGLALSCLLGFCLVELGVNGRLPGWAFAVMALPGALFLASWRLRRRTAIVV
jgi:hypothetical protein